MKNEDLRNQIKLASSCLVELIVLSWLNDSKLSSDGVLKVKEKMESVFAMFFESRTIAAICLKRNKNNKDELVNDYAYINVDSNEMTVAMLKMIPAFASALTEVATVVCPEELAAYVSGKSPEAALIAGALMASKDESKKEVPN